MKKKRFLEICVTILFLSGIISLFCLFNTGYYTFCNVEALSNGEGGNSGGGTCCPEDGSICIVQTVAFPNYYYLSEGPCNTSSDENN